ncbi:SPOR domain-containing protein [Sphingomonas hankyongi]|uniref:Tetratricopeptide repeat protein n=1 Tax=Sphingomonas hankyongi TaxID=2908209 RepID=A0ABT0S326_9SPHN|nr:tetratricopeptide repeat protein [Sphingomonas hankyongi]MCL6730282.1 tetratricopeptide repeat protein [Sphingomonas hankyongi]
MSKPFRFASAASFIVLAAMTAGCATPQKTGIREVKPVGQMGYATRAMAALSADDAATAIGFAEQAVQQSPRDAGFRALLGNCYFAAGRFASAEGAYKDSLTIYENQPRVILKLVLVQIALGKNSEAMSLLETARPDLDAADYGLALALAGRVPEAIEVLGPAARETGADGRVRQNLALAYAFSGDWMTARTIAAQDVPADKLDQRIQQWMQLANPTKSSDQVAALTGVTPVALDPGQPVRLALNPTAATTQVAQAEAPAPTPAQAVDVQPQPQFAAAQPPAPGSQVAEAAPPPPPARFYESEPATRPERAPVTVSMAAAAAPEAPAAFAAFAPTVMKAKPVPAKVRRASAPVRKPSTVQKGRSNAVVQLGAYKSPEYVAAAWNTLTKRYPALREYLPVRARFDSPKGTFWRLSIQGFNSRREAVARCELLQSRGGNCFVREVAGDAPVQIASR